MALEWLSVSDREWVARNGDLLEAIWDHFDATGEWPDPVEIMRQLRAADPSRRVNTALAEMPPALKREEFAPRRLELTIFGIGCCAKAEPLLRRYLAVARLALRRFDLPHLPNRLTRADVVAELELDEREADRLSSLLMRDAPFLGGGLSNLADWDREIDPRAEEFEGIESPHSLLTFLAAQRSVAVKPVHSRPLLATIPEPGGTAPTPSQANHLAALLPWLNAAAALGAIGAFVLALVSSPSPAGLAVLGFSLFLLAALRFHPRSLRMVGLAALVGLLIGGVAGWQLEPDDGHGPYRYFVASTGDADALVARIEPRPGAPMQRETVLGTGDPVSVSCLQPTGHEEWAKLVNGSFVPAGLLTAEVGGGHAPVC